MWAWGARQRWWPWWLWRGRERSSQCSVQSVWWPGFFPLSPLSPAPKSHRLLSGENVLKATGGGVGGNFVAHRWRHVWVTVQLAHSVAIMAALAWCVVLLMCALLGVELSRQALAVSFAGFSHFICSHLLSCSWLCAKVLSLQFNLPSRCNFAPNVTFPRKVWARAMDSAKCEKEKSLVEPGYFAKVGLKRQALSCGFTGWKWWTETILATLVVIRVWLIGSRGVMQQGADAAYTQANAWFA